MQKINISLLILDPSQFEDNVFGMALPKVDCVKPEDVPEGVAFVAQKGDKKILFCFDDQDENLLSSVASKIEDCRQGRIQKYMRADSEGRK